jgi:hypothetical protein
MGTYEPYICTELFKQDMLPGPNPEERKKLAARGQRISMEHVLWLDKDIIPSAFYGETTWVWPQHYPGQIPPDELARIPSNPKPMFAHVHDFPELLSWWGTDPDHPEDTSGMAMIMGDEEIPLPASWVAYIPAGIQHMPVRPSGARVTSNPVCHWTSGPGYYTREEEHPEDSRQQPVPGHPLKTTQENLKYFVFGGQHSAARPAFMCRTDPRYTRPIAIINDEVIPGAEFGCETMWLLPGDHSASGQKLMEKHTEPFGTTIVIHAMNYDDITDLCAEAELWIGGEKHIIRKSFGAFIPPNVEQGPLIIRNIEKQLFFLMSYPVGQGIGKYTLI